MRTPTTPSSTGPFSTSPPPTDPAGARTAIAQRRPRLAALGLAALGLLALTWLALNALRTAEAQELIALPESVEAAVRADAAALAEVDPSEVGFARIEIVTWSDGCLGIYLPNILCTDALVEGFVVWAVADGEGFRYHASMTGAMLAARGIEPTSIPGAPIPPGTTPPVEPPIPPPGGTVSAGQVPLTGGFGLVVFGGGSYDELVGATGCPLSTARFWATVDGAFVVLIPGSQVAAPNAAFEDAFGGFIPSGTPLIATCPPDAGTKTGIAGIVTRGPITPVCQLGIPCDAPFIATLIVRDTQGVEVARTTSATTGWYLVGVAPGTYILDPLDLPFPLPLPLATPMQVVVPDEGFAIVNVSFDTGIR